MFLNNKAKGLPTKTTCGFYNYINDRNESFIKLIYFSPICMFS